MPDEYISREAALKAWLVDLDAVIDCLEVEWGYEGMREDLYSLPVVDAVPVVRCKDCKYSTLPSELTQRYGKPGTLTCHNRYAPCNRRNVGGDDFCSYGEEREK